MQAQETGPDYAIFSVIAETVHAHNILKYSIESIVQGNLRPSTSPQSFITNIMKTPIDLSSSTGVLIKLSNTAGVLNLFGKWATQNFSRPPGLDQHHFHRPSLHADWRQSTSKTLFQLCFQQWGVDRGRSEEHTSELQSRPHISYAVFCLKKKKKHT